ncbi:hypothetical protein MPTK1_3g24630 [Marchantia polymorpha subsp. ruderalis]|uniref:RING-type domain-containing protein n=2 Tax=Marchantia polymorpha TaxID=3197 RepID=A0AAF6B4E7_MARPO|nr:hypothetical protein MARPO_0224s0007 [Marchantia polymorpha]PTQ27092.1 hypothetical protein MARPO_0224s0007 [Marchantia polymorpha]BBN06880.1 hypothetical protein Mp_3g24630 [Marchantia polymorpha subsp. ruderalis]BBN06881.1 hypothetical protein Mp_3g24630 [Marchantia polymorpha subsp. ruderalis]|eukprot:PTQ27091.1 hypothetical protein MARPO_0224s0007 [Marchantia polymorpha]
MVLELARSVEGGAGRGGGGGGGETCSICLEPISGEGFLDQCFHKFCYHCILQWSEMVISRPSSSSNRLQYLECPLCKTQYTSIIHDVSGVKFQRHYILTSRVPGPLKSEAHIRRQAVYASNSASLQPSSLTGLVPKPNRWLSCWVQRELQALMQEEDVDTVMHHVVGIVESFSSRPKGKLSSSGRGGRGGTEGKDFTWHATISAAVRPFIFESAERFAVELESFLVSGLDIAAFDQRSKLAACVRDRVTLSDEEFTLPSLKKDGQNAYDLYDEDVDEEFGHLMVRKTSSELERFSSEERSDTMKKVRQDDDTGNQERNTSQRESAFDRPVKKDTGKHAVKDSTLDRGRSKHRSESRKKRKSRSSSSRSSTPPRHKRRKRDKSVKSRSRKKRKHSKKKDKKSSQEHKRKSRKSRSRKNVSSSSDNSSYSESSRSGRSLSPVERGARRKASKRDQTFADNPINEKTDIRKTHTPDDERRTRDRRKSPRRYRSRSFEPREKVERKRLDGSSLEDFGKPRRARPGHRGSQEFERKDRYSTDAEGRSLSRTPDTRYRARPLSIDAERRSLSRSPDARFRTRPLSTSISPRVSAGRKSWYGPGSSSPHSPSPMDDDQTVRWVPSLDIPAQRADVVEEDAKTLETKLREQALANLMRHLNQKKNTTISTSVGEPVEITAVDKQTQEYEAPPAMKELKSSSYILKSEVRSCKDADERDEDGVLETNSQNVDKDVTHVEEIGDDAHSDTELVTPSIDNTKGKGGVVELSSSLEAAEVAIPEDLQASGVSYGKATSLEGRDIVVELVVDKEPFEFDLPIRDSTAPMLIADQIGLKKHNTCEVMTEGKKGLAKGTQEDGDSCVQEACDPQLEIQLTKSPFESRQTGNLSSCFKDISSVGSKKSPGLTEEPSPMETSKCGVNEKVVIVNHEIAAITVEDGEHTDSAIVDEESAKNESTSEKTQSCLNDESKPGASSTVREDGDEAGESGRFQQKSMSVSRGGESVQVSYKVYIPQRAAAARRRLQR